MKRLVLIVEKKGKGHIFNEMQQQIACYTDKETNVSHGVQCNVKYYTYKQNVFLIISIKSCAKKYINEILPQLYLPYKRDITLIKPI